MTIKQQTTVAAEDYHIFATYRERQTRSELFRFTLSSFPSVITFSPSTSATQANRWRTARKARSTTTRNRVSWPTLTGWVAYGWPVYYDYGQNAYHYNGSVYYGDQPVAR